MMVGNMALLWQGLVMPAWGPSTRLPQCTYPTLDLWGHPPPPLCTLGLGRTPPHTAQGVGAVSTSPSAMCSPVCAGPKESKNWNI